MVHSSLDPTGRIKAVAKAARRARWRITWKHRWQTDIFDCHTKNFLFNVHNGSGYYLLALTRFRRRIERVDCDEGSRVTVDPSKLPNEVLDLIEKVLGELPR